MWLFDLRSLYKDVVVCDICNEDFTDSYDVGGGIIGSWAYCPKCAEKIKPKTPNAKSVFDEEAQPHETFFEFVLRVRRDAMYQFNQ